MRILALYLDFSSSDTTFSNPFWEARCNAVSPSCDMSRRALLHGTPSILQLVSYTRLTLSSLLHTTLHSLTNCTQPLHHEWWNYRLLPYDLAKCSLLLCFRDYSGIFQLTSVTAIHDCCGEWRMLTNNALVQTIQYGYSFIYIDECGSTQPPLFVGHVRYPDNGCTVYGCSFMRLW